MGKLPSADEVDARYMSAVAQLVVDERERIQDGIQRSYERASLGTTFFTTDVKERRSNAFIEVAFSALEELRDFIREKHSAFLSDAPKRFLLKDWQELATKQLGTLCAFCSVAHDAVVNKTARAEPEFQRRCTKQWDDRWVPLVQKFSKQLEADSVLKTPRDMKPHESIFSKKFFAEEAAKPVIALLVTAIASAIAGAALLLWHYVLSTWPFFKH